MRSRELPVLQMEQNTLKLNILDTEPMKYYMLACTSWGRHGHCNLTRRFHITSSLDSFICKFEERRSFHPLPNRENKIIVNWKQWPVQKCRKGGYDLQSIFKRSLFQSHKSYQLPGNIFSHSDILLDRSFRIFMDSFVL